MKNLKTIVYFITMFLALSSCSKEDTNTDENSSNTQVNTITTWAHTFQPSTLSCNIGDTVRIMETRPLSASKCWRLVEIIERAK